MATSMGRAPIGSARTAIPPSWTSESGRDMHAGRRVPATVVGCRCYEHQSAGRSSSERVALRDGRELRVLNAHRRVAHWSWLGGGGAGPVRTASAKPASTQPPLIE